MPTAREPGAVGVLGETGERPAELANGIDHLDKLETLGKSAKDRAFSDGYTGNMGLLDAKLPVSPPPAAEVA